MKKQTYRAAFLLSILFLINVIGYAQEKGKDSLNKKDPTKDRKWRIETEPSSYVFKGYGLQISRTITKDNRLNIGLYTIALDVPSAAKERMFSNVDKDANARLSFEMALVARYVIKLGKKETNPYVGFLTGYEYFDITQSNVETVRISTLFLTPYVGYEIYFFKQMLYINPQFRGVLYFNSKSNNATRPEALKPFFFLPAISLGIRI